MYKRTPVALNEFIDLKITSHNQFAVVRLKSKENS